MNLTTDSWIPVVWNDGATRLANLTDIFVRGHEIRDLAVRPHERIALLRLFMCVAHAAVDGPRDREDWEDCLGRLAAAAKDYLARWASAFELFGEGQRFLQVPNLKATKTEEGEGNSVSKLDMALATGNNPTLFDNSGGDGRAFSPEQIALLLLTFQCFSTCGTIGVALWDNKPTPGWKSYPKPAPGQSNHAPCLAGSMLHAFLRAATLLATIHLNLLSQDDVLTLPGILSWGRPIWEWLPASPEDAPSIANATKSYLGRLVPLSRAIRLDPDGRGMLLANALDYPSWPEAREASATIVMRIVKGQPDRFVMPASLDKAVWRELHALSVKSAFSKDVGGPLALNNLAGDQAFDLWIGALVAAGNGKVLDTLEAVYHVPAAMLASGGHQSYAKGIEFAEKTASRLGKAISLYRLVLETNEPDLTHYIQRQARLKKPERERHELIGSAAVREFWTQAELNISFLVASVGSSDRPSDPESWSQSDWGKIIRQSAREAYETACPHETARQLQAFVKGLTVLSPISPNHSK